MCTQTPKRFKLAQEDIQITKTKYCLYARKSSESEERQALSIDSQIKDMFDIASRDGLGVTKIKARGCLSVFLLVPPLLPTALISKI